MARSIGQLAVFDQPLYRPAQFVGRFLGELELLGDQTGLRRPIIGLSNVGQDLRFKFRRHRCWHCEAAALRPRRWRIVVQRGGPVGVRPAGGLKPLYSFRFKFWWYWVQGLS